MAEGAGNRNRTPGGKETIITFLLVLLALLVFSLAQILVLRGCSHRAYRVGGICLQFPDNVGADFAVDHNSGQRIPP